MPLAFHFCNFGIKFKASHAMESRVCKDPSYHRSTREVHRTYHWGKQTELSAAGKFSGAKCDCLYQPKTHFTKGSSATWGSQVKLSICGCITK